MAISTSSLLVAASVFLAHYVLLVNAERMGDGDFGIIEVTERLGNSTCTIISTPGFCFHNPKHNIHGQSSPSVDDCCSACEHNPECKAFSYSPSESMCFFFDNVDKSTIKKGSTGCLAGISGPAPPVPPRGDKPNIVYLVVESTDGRTWSRGYQNDVIPLPNLRELQEGGLEFHKHYANAPVCCPSRATFWSGRHASNIPHDHNGVAVGGAWNNYEGLPSNFSDRMDQVLGRNNYNVLMSGKTDWSTGGHSMNVRLNSFTMYTQFPYDIPTNSGWSDEGGTCASNSSVGNGNTYKNTSAHKGDWNTADSSCEWISNTKDDIPFFVYQGMNIVHPPYSTNQYWWDKIDPSKIEVPAWPALEQLHPCDFQSSMLKGCTPSKNNSEAFYSIDRRRDIRRAYYAMIAEFDAMVGQYMDTIKAKGVWNQTVFIVTSDHGDMQMEHQQHYKMVPYDASACVPMVIYDGRPGKQVPKPGKIITTTSQLIDIFPTVMEYAQIPKDRWPAELDGQSLLPLFEDESSTTALAAPNPRPSFVVSQFHGCNIAMSWFLVVKTGVKVPGTSNTTTMKLIIWGTGKEVPSMLYDLEQDPTEYNNLINNTKYAPVIEELNKDLMSVIDYPKVAMSVATYGQEMFRQFMNATPNWKDAIHAPGLRWDNSWNYDPEGAIKAIEDWLAKPPQVLACRKDMVWPPKN